MSSASRAQSILTEANISINEACNGIWLPGTPQVANLNGTAVHSYIHTPRYINALTRRLMEAKQQGDVMGTLRRIGEEIQRGVFPH
jgi:hypothetical protein